ncbi:MAG: DEAD/DEAH box helicase family protein [Chloroflexi bacterium]|nr:DEAD/DEAH box helicase family protein [Chloroflexota bacterium]
MDDASFLALGYRRSPGQGRQPLAQVVVLRCQVGAEAPGPTGGEAPGGLQAELVAESSRPGPTFARRLRQLVAGSTVVGFDLPAALAELGLAPAEATTWIDLLDLGSLVLPGLASYSEASLREALGLAAVEAQDARATAASSAAVHLGLLAAIDALDLDTLMHVNRLAAPLTWPYKPLFAQAERRKVRQFLAAPLPGGGQGLLGAPLAPPPAGRAREPLTPSSRPHKLAIEALVAMLGREGALGRSLASFEERPEQQAMVRSVAQVFNEAGTLLVEAGTGTGKSLAYLLPAAHFAVANNRRVVISTNTINLQDQLFRKDVPEIQRGTSLALRATVLKGRTNYLCLRRWYALLRTDDLEPHERSLLIKTLLWVPRTTSGDRAELRLVGREGEAWMRVCALAETCTPLHCQFHRAGVCFLARARRAAEDSHLVIVNHSLLLADIVSRSQVLPDYDHLVIDEAHHLEQEATNQLGWRTSQRELLARLHLLVEPPGSPPAGLVRDTFRLLKRAPGSPRRGQEADRLSALEAQLQLAVERACEATDHLFALLRRVLEARGQGADGQLTARLSTAARAQPAWTEVELAWAELADRLQHLLALLGELQEQVEATVSAAFEELAEADSELAAQLTYWGEATQRLAAILAEYQPDLVAWLSAARNEDIWVHAAPLHVGPLLQQALFRSKDTVVLTSATLSTDGHFRYVKERLGLEEADELRLGSPFDYRQAALVYLPRDMPEPTQPGYQERVQQAILAQATALGGRCLVLFTSYAQLRATYLALRQPLAEVGITLLAQGQDGASRAALLDAFKADQGTVLLGTSSFWEGVDVVGEALSCLIVPRLPFSVPSDPIFEARSEAFDDPFGQYAVPQAILRFKQGFGRLIRSRRDRGAVVVLDRRLDSKFYGRAFLRSLPGCTLERGLLADAPAVARAWLSDQAT